MDLGGYQKQTTSSFDLMDNHVKNVSALNRSHHFQHAIPTPPLNPNLSQHSPPLRSSSTPPRPNGVGLHTQGSMPDQTEQLGKQLGSMMLNDEVCLSLYLPVKTSQVADIHFSCLGYLWLT